MQALSVGLLLTVVGMGTVVAFLALVACCIETSARALARFAQVVPRSDASRCLTKAPETALAGQDTLIPVIVAALHRHLSGKP